MKMMGLRDSAYWLSFGIYTFILNLIISIISLILLYAGNAIEYSHWSLLLFLFLLYGLAIFGFALLVASFFSKVRIAAIVGIMLFFVTYFVSENITVEKEAYKVLLSFFPTSALNFGIKTLVEYEKSKEGLNYSNATEKIDNYRFSNSLLMLLLDFVLFTALSLYFDNILPSQNEVRKPPHYFLLRSYWKGSCQSTSKMPMGIKVEGMSNIEEISESLFAQEGRGECLKIEELSRAFGEHRAVDNLSLTMYEGQIFALLGHNGAGKTTTLDMLTGGLSKDSGEAWAYHINIFQEKPKFRKMMGICPQHDVLFQNITVEEHLEMFSVFKGMPYNKVKEAVSKILRDLELTYAKNREVHELSGGERRKLSIALAFIGDSKIILLDEPTSGLDTTARRLIWNILKMYKKDRIVILTTHYMDEADFLGDRVAIMAEGKIRCLGSPLFLKSRFGGGYTLSCMKLGGRRSEGIESLVREMIPTSKTLTDVRSSISFQLPLEEENNFPLLFNSLDADIKNGNALGVESYGLAITSLEEVFIKVGNMKDSDLLFGGEGGKESSSLSPENITLQVPSEDAQEYCLGEENEQGAFPLFLGHFIAVIWKRVLHTYRNMGTLFTEIFIPILLIVAILSLTLIKYDPTQSSMYWDPDDFPTPSPLIYNKNGGAFTSTDLDTFLSYLPPHLNPKPYILTDNTTVDEDESTSLDSVDSVDVDSTGTVDNLGYFRRWKEFEEHLVREADQDPSAFCAMYINKLDLESKQVEVLLYTNMSSMHSSPAFANFIGESFIRAASGNPEIKVEVGSHPFPPSYAQDNGNKRGSNFFTLMLINIAMALIPASVITFIVKEREENLKHQQIISGVSLFSYWSSNGLVDLAKSLFSGCIAIMCYYLYDADVIYYIYIIYIYIYSVLGSGYSYYYMQDL